MTASAERLAEWVGRQVARAGARGIVVGLNGGVESAVVLRLCQLAVGDRVVAVLLPCHGDAHDEAAALAAADHFGVARIRADLTLACEGLLADLGGAVASLPPALLRHTPAPGSDQAAAARGAVVPRLRMAALYYIAESLTCLVAGSATRGDLEVGGFTRHGEVAADLLPLGALLEREVRMLATGLGVPRSIIDEPAGGRQSRGQPAGTPPGFTPQELERYLDLGPEGVPPATALRIERHTRHAERRREPPAIPDV